MDEGEGITVGPVALHGEEVWEGLKGVTAPAEELGEGVALAVEGDQEEVGRGMRAGVTRGG